MRKIRKRIFYKIGIVAFIVGVGLLLLFREQDVDREIKIMTIERSIRSAINQGECHHPNLPIDNPEIMKFYQNVDKIDCGNKINDWVTCEKSICFVKPEILAIHHEVTCSYTDIIRSTDYKAIYGSTTKTQETYILQKSDFAKVVCHSAIGESWYGMVAGIRDGVEKPSTLQLDATTYYNVLMFGFDSLSRNAFIRKLPKTYAYLVNELHAIVLKGYNIVGDGTPQALVPLLTGYTELELPETRKRIRNSEYVDVYPMIWKDYARHGYVTSFNEDVPDIGTFTYRLNGFNTQPVDHYLRTLYNEVSNIWNENKMHCVGHQQDHVLMLNYTKNFMTKYSDMPRFVFSFHGGLSHDSINLIGTADDDVRDWLETLKTKQLLENTILIFMSDHGNRFADVRATLQGKQEERLPFFSFSFPQTFQQRFPIQYANFVDNIDRLSTPFDIHATLKHLLALQLPLGVAQPKLQSSNDVDAAFTSEVEPKDDSAQHIVSQHTAALAKKRAISLFNVIPKNRSCANAYIEPHWCACLRWQQLALNESSNIGILIKMADNIVETINNATKKYRNLCMELNLQTINWAMRLVPHKDMLRFKGNSDRDGFLADLSDNMDLHNEIYQLQIVVAPGESLFEATVTRDLHTFETITQLSEISRVNRYGEQANCIYERDPELRKYCYCRNRH